MTDSSYETDQQKAYNAAVAQSESGGGGYADILSGLGSGSRSGAGAYTDKDIFELQSALNQGALVQTNALTGVQKRTDEVVTKNVDYFKELANLSTELFKPYVALASQGAGFYLDAVGANGSARQQAALPQATNIFNQQGINATPFLQSIPNWSLNNAMYQSSQAMNSMFGQAAPNAQNQQQFLPQNQVSGNSGQLQQPGTAAGNLPSQANPFVAGGIGQVSAADQRAKQIAELEAQIKANDTSRTTNQQTLQTKFNNYNKVTELQRELSNKDNYLKNYNPNNKLNGANDLTTVQAQKAELEKQIAELSKNAFTQQEIQNNKQLFDNTGKLDATKADASFLTTGNDLNTKLQALKNYQDPAAPEQQALTLNSQAPQAAPNQQLMDFTNKFKNTSIGSLTAEANAATNQTMGQDLNRSNRFLDLMESELNTDRSNFANDELNKLLDPATGAVNNWINSDLVKNVMGTAVQSGTNAVQNAQAARGMLDSGQTLAELQKVGTNAAGQYIVPMAGQLANNVLSQGAALANSRLSNYYNLLGQGAQYAQNTQAQRNSNVNGLVNTGAGMATQGLQFANSLMQTQAGMTQNLNNQYSGMANQTLQNLMSNSNNTANNQSALQVGGLANLLQSGQGAANSTANVYGNLGTNVAGQTVYGNDIYGTAEMQKARIESDRLAQMAKLNNMERRANGGGTDQSGNAIGLGLSLGAMLLGGGL